MKRPSSKHLTYPYPAYEGCTLNELVICALTSYLAYVFCLTIVGGLFLNKFVLFFFVLVGIYPIPKMAVKRLAKVKKGKPQGYFLIKLRLKIKASPFSGLSEYITTLSCPYITRQGRWSTHKRIRKNHV